MPPRPRLDDVAVRAGVSTATVSLVLRGLAGPGAATREAVLAAAAELGYRPDRTASLLARRRTRLLGVTMDIGSTFQAELVEHLQGAADSRGYDLVVSPVTRTHDERRAIELLLDFRCETVVLIGPTLADHDLATLAADHHVVAIGRPTGPLGVDVVRAADDEGVARVVEHLAALGHRRISYLDGPRGAIATRRRQGYRAAVRRLVGAPFVQVVQAGATEADGLRGVAALWEEPPGGVLPTAVVAYNDRVALGALDGLRRAGLTVPHDVSLVGYDDSPLARLATVDLTSVSQEAEGLAVAAVEAAVQRLDEGRTDPVEVVLEPRLVVRSTTAPPPEV